MGRQSGTMFHVKHRRSRLFCNAQSCERGVDYFPSGVKELTEAGCSPRSSLGGESDKNVINDAANEPQGCTLLFCCLKEKAMKASSTCCQMSARSLEVQFSL